MLLGQLKVCWTGESPFVSCASERYSCTTLWRFSATFHRNKLRPNPEQWNNGNRLSFWNFASHVELLSECYSWRHSSQWRDFGYAQGQRETFLYLTHCVWVVISTSLRRGREYRPLFGKLFLHPNARRLWTAAVSIRVNWSTVIKF